MTDNQALENIAKELKRQNDLKEIELFLAHNEWSNPKYADKQKIIADLLCESINNKLENGSYVYKKD